MSFQPVIPFGGYAGWAFLKRTMASQQTALQSTPTNQRDEAYFRDRFDTTPWLLIYKRQQRDGPFSHALQPTFLLPRRPLALRP